MPSGNITPTSRANSRALSVVSSMAIPTTRTSGWERAKASTAGISSRHGPHHEAHRFTTVGRAAGLPISSDPRPVRRGTCTTTGSGRSAAARTSGAAPVVEDPQADMPTTAAGATATAATEMIQRGTGTHPSLAGRADRGCPSVRWVQADDVTHAILMADRRAGDGIRATISGVPGGRDWARLAADAMAPAFQGLALALVVIPGSRMLGLRAVAAGAIAGALAKVARDAIDRPRPGSRTEGGFPSRHAASSAAIAVVVARERPLVGAAAHAAAALGMAARVAAADHDPLDIVAGAGLGAAAGRLMRRRRRRRRGTRP